MGAFLSSPHLDKEIDSGLIGQHIKYATCSMQGWRCTMEDKILVRETIDNYPGWFMFAVFDGHGGTHASKLACENLSDYIKSQLMEMKLDYKPENDETEFESEAKAKTKTDDKDCNKNDEKSETHYINKQVINVELFPSRTYKKDSFVDIEQDKIARAIQKAFILYDDDMRYDSNYIKSKENSGTTVSLALFTTDKVYVANLGDSRTLVKSNRCQLRQCSKWRSFYNEKDNTSDKKNFIDLYISEKTNTNVTDAGYESHVNGSIVDDVDETIIKSLPNFFHSSDIKPSEPFQDKFIHNIHATIDHKPDDIIEHTRIKSANGVVVAGRVNYTLAVSRALGDYDYKQDVDISAHAQIISVVPDVYVLDKSSDLQFMVIACDGIWDVLTNEDVASFVYYQLSAGVNLNQITKNLINTCLNEGSRDNMSVIIIYDDTKITVDPSIKYEYEARLYQIEEIVNNMKLRNDKELKSEQVIDYIEKYYEKIHYWGIGGSSTIKQYIDELLGKNKDVLDKKINSDRSVKSGRFLVRYSTDDKAHNEYVKDSLEIKNNELKSESKKKKVEEILETDKYEDSSPDEHSSSSGSDKSGRHCDNESGDIESVMQELAIDYSYLKNNGSVPYFDENQKDIDGEKKSKNGKCQEGNIEIINSMSDNKKELKTKEENPINECNIEIINSEEKSKEYTSTESSDEKYQEASKVDIEPMVSEDMINVHKTNDIILNDKMEDYDKLLIANKLNESN